MEEGHTEEISFDEFIDILTEDRGEKIKQELTEKFPSLDVRFACLHYNKPSNFEIDWYGSCIDKVNQDVWVVYPWEDWFDRDAVENTVVNDIIGRIK